MSTKSKEYTAKAAEIVEQINKLLQDLKDLSATYGGQSFSFCLDLNDTGVSLPYSDSKEQINSFTVGNEEIEVVTEDEEGNEDYEYQTKVTISQWLPSSMSC